MSALVGLVVSSLLFLGLHEDMLYPRAFANFTGNTVFGAFTEKWGAVFPMAVNYDGMTGLGHLGSGITPGLREDPRLLRWFALGIEVPRELAPASET